MKNQIFAPLVVTIGILLGIRFGVCVTLHFVVDLGDYRAALRQAKIDFANAEMRRDDAARVHEEAEREMVQLRRAVTALAALCGEDVDETIGITAAVRTVFKNADPGVWQTLESLKHQVEALGVVLTDRKNPTASLMSAVKRLHESGEIVESVSQKRKVWKLKTGHSSEGQPAGSITDDDIPF